MNQEGENSQKFTIDRIRGSDGEKHCIIRSWSLRYNPMPITGCSPTCMQNCSHLASEKPSRPSPLTGNASWSFLISLS